MLNKQIIITQISEINGPVINATGNISNAYSEIFCRFGLIIKSFLLPLN